ncbi:MAG: SUMF1/EgtB/PvdO family nonheme iron enzyme [Pirellulales bacterium]
MNRWHPQVGTLVTVQYRPIAEEALKVLPKGNYWVGDDAITQSAPRHLRRFRVDAWIEPHYVPWTAFAEFVAAGGFAEKELWQTATGRPFPPGCIPLSVDVRCDEVREATLAGMPAALLDSGTIEAVPVLGLTWFEASAVCRFFGGRLPYEAEWEVASTRRLLPSPRKSSVLFQEWTGDVWSSRYWRADGSIRGRPWEGGGEVAVRGYATHEPAFAATARRAADPAVGLPARAFRRAWDRLPSHVEAPR